MLVARHSNKARASYGGSQLTCPAQAKVKNLAARRIPQVDAVLLVQSRSRRRSRGIEGIRTEDEGERGIARITRGRQVEVDLVAWSEQATRACRIDSCTESRCNSLAVDLREVHPENYAMKPTDGDP